MRFLMKKRCKKGISRIDKYGPVFGQWWGALTICDHCNREDSCYIDFIHDDAYECQPEYRSSLFVDKNDNDERNRFSVLDYEVYALEKKIFGLF